MADETLTDEKFWTEFKDLLFSEDKLESSEEEIEKIIDLADLEKGMKVLDMPCGVGRHSIKLKKKGFNVVGVDKTEAYIEDAQQKESDDIEFLQDDMKDFRRENSFDAVINWWNSFGYFENKEDDRRMLDNIQASLKEDGVLVMDLWSKEISAMNDFSRHWADEDGIYNLEKGRPKDNWKKVERTWIKVDDGETVKYTWEQRLYAASELEQMLKEVGFSNVDFYGNVDGDDFDDDADRLVVVAKK
jgi:cyclopropane fatty-acyl-phospholipid synthase-like methyltransferase